MKDLYDTVAWYAAPDARSCLAIAKYHRIQAGRFYKRAMALKASRSTLEEVRRLVAAHRPRAPARVALRTRNRRIVAHAARGWTNKALGAKFGLSENYVGRIVRDAWSRSPAPVLPRCPAARSPAADPSAPAAPARRAEG